MIKKLEDSVYQLTYEVPVKVVPPVNGYLIMGERPILIDGGASDDATYSGFIQDIATLGLKPRDLGAVLVTHNHLDHIGLASRLAKEIDIQVHVHEDEWFMVTANEEKREAFRQKLMDTFTFWGVPESILVIMQEKLLRALRFGGGIPMEKVQPYPKGKFTVCGICLDPIHCPGHTEGLVCLWWEDKKSIFSNDHVLETISPNPTIYLQGRNGRQTGLADYLESLGFVENLPAQKVYPGHGHAFNDLKGRIGDIRSFAEDRRAKILSVIKETSGGASILELTSQIWDNLDPVNTFLGAREVHGFMEIFIDEGIVTLDKRGKVGYFRTLPPNKEQSFENVATLPPGDLL